MILRHREKNVQHMGIWASSFSELAAALHGDYHSVDAAFFEATDQAADHIRLHALVHNLNTDFTDDMRERGQTMIVVSDTGSESDGHESGSEDSRDVPR